MSKNEPVVEVKDLQKTYELGKIDVPALLGVSFSVPAGEFVSVMGPSGCGKSTLMNLIGCLDHPSSGQVILEGKDISHLDDNELAKTRNKKIGFVFQTFNLLPRFSSLENVELPLIYSGIQTQERHKLAKEMLKKVGMGDRMGHKPPELSGGQRQKVAIARALINNPSLILADEPTGNLDSRSGEEIMGIFQGLNDQGITIIMVTHEADIARHSNRIIRLFDGKMIKDEKIEPFRFGGKTNVPA